MGTNFLYLINKKMYIYNFEFISENHTFKRKLMIKII